jgi:hypothetical protein
MARDLPRHLFHDVTINLIKEAAQSARPAAASPAFTGKDR